MCMFCAELVPLGRELYKQRGSLCMGGIGLRTLLPHGEQRTVFSPVLCFSEPIFKHVSATVAQPNRGDCHEL